MKKANVSIGLVNPKSPDNVGSVMRAAGNYRVDCVFYTGHRYPRALMRNPQLPDMSRPNMSRKVSQNIPLLGVTSLLDDLPENMKIVCVEFAENAISLPDYEHPDSALYIFGPEDGTMSQSIIDRADAVVYIPTIGCMNLAATVNVVLYDRLAKSSLNFTGNDIIFDNRDKNNRLKVSQ